MITSRAARIALLDEVMPEVRAARKAKDFVLLHDLLKMLKTKGVRSRKIDFEAGKLAVKIAAL